MRLTYAAGTVLLILLISPCACAGEDGSGSILDQIEADLAMQALRLVELRSIHSSGKGLPADTSGQDGEEILSRLSEVDASLAELEEILASAALPPGSDDHLERLTRDLSILREEVSRLEQATRDLGATLTLGRGEAVQCNEESTSIVTRTVDELATFLALISDSVRGSLLELSSLVGDGLGLLANAASVETGSTAVSGVAAGGIWPVVIAAMAIMGAITFAAQSFYTRESPLQRLARISPRLGLGRTMPEEGEVLSTINQPFWDPVDEAETGGNASSSVADDEYIRMLFELGYTEEALKATEALEKTRGHSRSPPKSAEESRGAEDGHTFTEALLVPLRAGLGVAKHALLALAARSTERRRRARKLYRKHRG